jgi:hypothetical protein
VSAALALAVVALRQRVQQRALQSEGSKKKGRVNGKYGTNTGMYAQRFQDK